MQDPLYITRLRAQAEQAFAELKAGRPDAVPLNTEDAAHLLHELDVYRTELELQNQELLSSQSLTALANERYLSLFHHLPIAALVVNRRGLITNDNALAHDLLGHAPHGSGQEFRLTRALAQPDRLRLLEVLARTQEGEATVCQDLNVHASPAAEPRVMHCTCMALPEEQYAEPQFLLLLLDQTAERKAHENQRLTEAVFQSASEGILVTDRDVRMLHVNPAFERMTGYSRDELRGQKVSMLKSGRQPFSFYEGLWRTLLNTGRWQGEFTNRHRDGHYYTVWCNITQLRGANGEVSGYMGVQTDTSELQRAHASIHKLTSFDALTGLPNRMLYSDRLSQQLQQAKRSGTPFSVFFLDLDHFKEVNDTLGHAVGDELLKLVATRLQNAVRAQDTVGRLGGDEFVVLLPDTHPAGAQAVAENLLNELATPIDLPPLQDYRVQASVGIAHWPLHGDTADLLLRHADTAMYAAKMGGRRHAVVYRPDMSEKASEEFALQKALGLALERGELRAVYQPIFNTKSGQVCGAEALIRWQHPEHGLLLPGAFLPTAVRAGLMHGLDQWMMITALRQLGTWQAQGLWPPGWTLSFNQGAQDITHPEWLNLLKTHLPPQALAQRCVQVELNEGTLMQPSADTLERLRQMQALGVDLSIDDFGTGYSSLAYLKNLPVSTLKIDQSFVRDMLHNAKDRAVVDAVVAMAHKMGFALVAEGVETVEQRQLLAQLGCNRAQGFLVAKGLRADAFQAAYLTHATADTPQPQRVG